MARWNDDDDDALMCSMNITGALERNILQKKLD
jgi:hypothetical protein